jgi:TolB protein
MLLRALCAALALAAAAPAGAVIRIEITQGVDGAQPIAVAPFVTDAEAGLDLAAVIAADLARSGRFRPLARDQQPPPPADGERPDPQRWRAAGADSLVVGRVTRAGQGWTVRFQLFDTLRGSQLLGYSIPVPAGELRRAAHRIADMVYEKLTGQPGAFSASIAFITEVRDGDQRRYQLVVAGSDGEDPSTVVQSVAPLMSPSWSPDGRRLAYVSFENRVPQVFVQDLATGKREIVSDRPGINGAPVWSPDGKRLALTLSSGEGNPDIYVLELATRKLTRITLGPAIDTEPSWFPDGERIAFTSDRGGAPQVYEVNVRDLRSRRLSFEGDWNARPAVAPDGKSLALVTREQGSFRIAALDLGSGTLRTLTDGRLDESPSFAPNGAMILYATEFRGRGILAAVSTDGRVRQRLALTEGDVREPAWSPSAPGTR